MMHTTANGALPPRPLKLEAGLNDPCTTQLNTLEGTCFFGNHAHQTMNYLMLRTNAHSKVVISRIFNEKALEEVILERER